MGSSRTRNGFESLLVGYYEGRKLLFASKVRAGLTPHIRAELFPPLKAIDATTCPFANLPSSKTGHWGEGITAEDMTALRWVKPKIVVEVSFVEWTRDGLLRHPEFVGVRDDKSPREIGREDGMRRLMLHVGSVTIAMSPDRPICATGRIVTSVIRSDLVDAIFVCLHAIA